MKLRPLTQHAELHRGADPLSVRQVHREADSRLPLAVPSPISPEPLPAVLLYADDIAEFCPLAFPPAPSLGPVPSSFLVVVCVVDLIYTE